MGDDDGTTTKIETITLSDESGEEEEFELLGTIAYDRKAYAVLGPLDSFDGEYYSEVAILEAVEEEGGTSYVEVEDEGLVDMLYDAFVAEDAT